jgi:hypothetical protein
LGIVHGFGYSDAFGVVEREKKKEKEKEERRRRTTSYTDQEKQPHTRKPDHTLVFSRRVKGED